MKQTPDREFYCVSFSLLLRKRFFFLIKNICALNFHHICMQFIIRYEITIMKAFENIDAIFLKRKKFPSKQILKLLKNYFFVCETIMKYRDKAGFLSSAGS
jgi:hypothetical protein